jgi:hypothetical protein
VRTILGGVVAGAVILLAIVGAHRLAGVSVSEGGLTAAILFSVVVGWAAAAHGEGD